MVTLQEAGDGDRLVSEAKLTSSAAAQTAEETRIPPKPTSLYDCVSEELHEVGVRDRIADILAMRKELCKLGQYALAGSLLKEELDKLSGTGVYESDGSKMLEDAYNENLKLLEESTLGKYELTEYYMSGFEEDEAPELAEYVGHVVVSSAAPGKGRGVFLTKPVSKGELLIVSNAVGLHIGDIVSGSSLAELDRKIMQTCKGSSIKLAQVLSLQSDKHELDLLRRIGIFLPTDSVPSMELFRPNDWPALLQASKNMIHDFKELNLNMDKVLEWKTRHMQKAGSGNVGGSYCGLWVLPSLMNHSCLGNVSLHRVGEALLVVASRDMEAGTELEYSYGDTYAPVTSRNVFTGFECKCMRCVFEKGLPEACKLRDFELGREAMKVEAEIAGLKLTQEQEDWLRVSHVLTYVEELETLPSHVAEAEMRALHSAVPGHSGNLQLMAYLNEMAGTPTAQALLEEECMALVGRLDRQALQAVIDHALDMPLTYFDYGPPDAYKLGFEE